MGVILDAVFQTQFFKMWNAFFIITLINEKKIS